MQGFAFDLQFVSEHMQIKFWSKKKPNKPNLLFSSGMQIVQCSAALIASKLKAKSNMKHGAGVSKLVIKET